MAGSDSLTATRPLLALGLAGPHLVELTGDPDLTARWDALPLAFTVLGSDRLDDAAPQGPTLDASAVAAALGGRTRSGRFLVAASPQRDHPYNLARRAASLAHLTRGRSGLLLGRADAYAPSGPSGPHEAWGGAGLGSGAPLTAATALDALRAVRALEQSWPFDSIVGDRASRILVRSDQIAHVDLDGAFAIEGPLNVPEAPSGPSVTAWWSPSSEDAARADEGVDLVVGVGGRVGLDRAPARPSASHGTDELARLWLPPVDLPLPAVLAEAERALAAGFAAAPAEASLRAALRLPDPPARPTSARRAFAPPAAHNVLATTRGDHA